MLKLSKMNDSKKMVSVVFLGIAAIIGAMNYFVIPKMTGLYTNFGENIPFLTQILINYGSYIMAAFFGLAMFTFFLNEPDELNIPWQMISIILISLMVGYLIVAVILPIYNITNSF